MTSLKSGIIFHTKKIRIITTTATNIIFVILIIITSLTFAHCDCKLATPHCYRVSSSQKYVYISYRHRHFNSLCVSHIYSSPQTLSLMNMSSIRNSPTHIICTFSSFCFTIVVCLHYFVTLALLHNFSKRHLKSITMCTRIRLTSKTSAFLCQSFLH